MANINILDPHVADLIAAGEVVERPGSVVKELLENSMDAGAKNITVEIRGGGITYIRVTDDGCGMAPEDAGVAFLRHATSKLRDEHGLEAIGTMGFRGEALAAISAVSRISLLTREIGAPCGTRVELEAGDIQDMQETGCPEGTTMVVRDLFFNTPARRKFIKSDRAEGAYCVQTALKSALGRPEISVRCIKDGKEEFFTPGDGRRESCIYSLLGRENLSALIPCSGEDGDISVSGYVSEPALCRGSRSGQYFFVHGRPVRSTAMQAALEQAYKNTMLTGRFPACVLYLETGLGLVDVNVHPTKAEVKFADEKRVFDAVYYAVLGALERKQAEEVGVPLSAGTLKAVNPVRHSAAEPAPVQRTGVGESAGDTFSGTETRGRAGLRAPVVGYQTRLDLPVRRENPAPAAYQKRTEMPFEENAQQETEPTEDTPVHLVGEAMGTYIIAQVGDELLLIDKHAAHERLIFDRLRAGSMELMSQSLMVPVVYKADRARTELIWENIELINGLGFEVESFGEDAVVIRAVPDGAQGDERAVMDEICLALECGATPEMTSRDRAFMSVACKAAIKAGEKNQPGELMELVEKVRSGQVRYCPHGRPVAVRLTKKELDKLFDRIV